LKEGKSNENKEIPKKNQDSEDLALMILGFPVVEF